MACSSARPFIIVSLLLAGCSHRHAGSQTTETSETPRPRNGGILITADDIQRSPGMSVEQLVITHVPGATLTRARDGHPVIRLRAENTILGDPEPLIVVNDVPLDPNVSGNLSAIDTHDIATIEVLRDAAATSLYGLRGANGVILIRTKQP